MTMEAIMFCDCEAGCGGICLLIRLTDVLDVAIIAYLVYKILCLVRSTRAENILKGVAIFLVALWLSSSAALNLRGVNYILSHMVEWGVLALIILFQPEIRRLLEQVGSRNIRLLRIFQPEQQSTELEQAIDQTVAACTDMSKTRTGVLIVFERKILLDDMRPQRHHPGRGGVQRAAEEHLLRQGPHARRRRHHPAAGGSWAPGVCCRCPRM